MNRINAKNRSKLDFDSESVNELVSKLSMNPLERKDFVKDPVGYLKKNSMVIPSGKISLGETPMTTEVTYVAAVYAAVAAVAVVWAAVQYHSAVVTQTSLWTSGGGGCFLKGMKISLKNGNYKPIEKISIGDEVLSYDETERRIEYNRVSNVFQTEQPEYYVINRIIKVTPRHRFYTNGSEWREAKELRVGDLLFSHNKVFAEVKSIDIVNENQTVYNLTVDKAHTFFVHDVLVHNAKPEEGGNALYDLGSPTTVL